MAPASRPKSTLTSVAFGAVIAALLAATAPATAQPSPETPAAAEPAAPGKEPRRGRERRRAAAAEETPAAPATATAATAEPATDAAGTEIICKDYKPTGTRMARRICATAAQWAANGESTSAQASEALRKMREQSSIVGTAPTTAAPGN